MNQVDSYISGFPDSVQERLAALQSLIKSITPDAVESISYGMPAYKVKNKPFAYFAGFDKHIGLYALPNTHRAFVDELSSYKQGKGSVQFPHDRELPLDLIEKMLRFRFAEMDSPK